MIAESIQEQPIPALNYVEIADFLSRFRKPVTPQRVREIEKRALRKLARRFPDLLRETGLAND